MRLADAFTYPRAGHSDFTSANSNPSPSHCDHPCAYCYDPCTHEHIHHYSLTAAFRYPHSIRDNHLNLATSHTIR